MTKKLLQVGTINIKYLDSKNHLKSVEVKSIRRLRDNRPVANIILEDALFPNLELQIIQKCGVLRATIVNRRDIQFAITEDQLINFGLGDYTMVDPALENVN